MSKRRRRTNFTAEQKVAIVREHLLEGVAVSAGVPRPRRPRARASGNPCGRTRTGPSTSAISTSAAPSYYLCSILDGASRSIVHWEIREAMTEADVEIIVQRARELYAEAGHTRIISDNGPQFIGRDFKLFVRELGLEHVRTSPYYPQWNGTKERFYQTLKGECLRP